MSNNLAPSFRVLLFVMFALFALPAAAQKKQLTLDDLYDPAHAVRFSSPQPSVQWLSDGAYLLAVPDGATRQIVWQKVDAKTGQSTSFLDAAKMQAALSKVSDAPADPTPDAPRRRNFQGVQWNAGHTAVLQTIGSDLYVYSLAADMAMRLTHSSAPKSNADFSPNGQWVSFVQDGNLHVAPVKAGPLAPNAGGTVRIQTPPELGAGGIDRALTTDGDGDHVNGQLDWVYQEEIYGRGHADGAWWSPDSTKIAYLHFDETRVPKFTISDELPYAQSVQTQRYPRPGDPNPIVTLRVVTVADGKTQEVSLPVSANSDTLIVRVAWTPDSRTVAYQTQDREQTHLNLNEADSATGQSRTVLTEKTAAWVEPCPLRFLADGGFVWASVRTGAQHLYHYDKDGKLIRPLMGGDWTVSDLAGVDEKNGWVYFSADKDEAIGRSAYRVKLDGSHLTRLTQSPGWHSVSYDPGFTAYTDGWSDVNTPAQTRLYATDGSWNQVLSAEPVAALQNYALGATKFLTVKARDGVMLPAQLILPPDFDPAKKYPVLEYTYSGPNAPTVANRWGGSLYLWHQLLAERGYVIWILDGRTALAKASAAYPLYNNFGAAELRDLEDGHAYLKSLPYIDGTRIGRWGWSFGGFMTAYALTHSTDYKLGIGGGTVTDWRDYDSVYTERYLRLPERNPDGYKTSAPRNAAAQLHGKLLLIHGAIDDNVHLQNTEQFVYALEQANKPFDLMLYPRSAHGVGDPLLVRHLRQLMTDYILNNL